MAAIVPCEHGWAPGICVTCLQRQLREAQEELGAWHQEFATTVNGKPYVMDALEAGKMVQDAGAEARMAKQDLDAAIERAEELERQIEALRGKMEVAK